MTAHDVLDAGALVDAAAAMVARLRRGGRLVAVGDGCYRSDAEHVAVEFLHPVIVGTPAVPAVAVPPWPDPAGNLAAIAGEGDVVVALGAIDLRAVRERGALTVALAAGAGPPGADHVLAVPAADPWQAKELFVTAYHLLWEVVHLILAGGVVEAGDLGATAGLYPFLAGGDGPSVLDEARRSTAGKLAEIGALRAAALDDARSALDDCADAVAAAVHRGGRVLTFGNGGSSTDALSLAMALSAPGPAAVPAWSLADDRATVTALANDVGFDVVFARQVDALAGADDVCVGLSTSGSSANVLRGLERAKSRGARTVGFAGYDGGDMATGDVVDHLFVVPSSSVHRIQEVQATLYLTLAALVRRRRVDPAPPPPPPARG